MHVWKGMVALAAWVAVGGLAVGLSLAKAESGLPAGATLDVETDPDGGVRAHAVLDLPATIPIVERVLTDYASWPQLFESRMRMTRIEPVGDRVITELFVAHPILPGESRLLSENRRQADGRLTTTLLGGDFKKYARAWHLSMRNPGRTHAEFDLLMQADTLAPDWMVAIALRKELETHFSRLVARIAKESTQP